MVGQVDRLGSLEMSVTRYHHIAFAFTELQQRSLEQTNLFQKFPNLIPQPQAHIQRHLVVAGPTGVQFGALRDPAC